MRFLMLGPLEAHADGGPVDLGGNKPCAVLAVLLLHANEPVSAERLALALWGEDAAGGSVKTVQVHVSRLRKALGDAEAITTSKAGYRLRVRPGELDVERFEQLVEDGRRALADGQPEHAATVLRSALELWRGTPLAQLAYEPFARAEVARLEESRLAAIEARVEADLACGRHSQLVGELQRLVGEHRTRERLAGQLMLALYRCGRQSDALDAFQEARRVLVEEVGVEPGPALRALQEAILRHDGALDVAAAAAPQLPPELDPSTAPPLTGRDDELAWLRLRWERARDGSGGLVVLAGERGAGKTRLASALAELAHRRGDTVLYASGRGAAAAWRLALRRIGAPGRPLLLVADDADEAEAELLDEFGAAADGVRGTPALVLACAEQPERLEHLRADGVLKLPALDAVAVGAIARQYASSRAPDEVPEQWLLEASGGIARRVHEVASQWARREAARRVSDGVDRAESGRMQLRSVQDELTGDVVELQLARGRIAPPRHEAVPVVCPYKGLASYEFADAEYFCGREPLVAQLVAQLVGAPLLAIVGPSGSGKSSLLRAGLLPALAGGVLPRSDEWRQITMRPGEHPLRDLRDALREAGGDRRALLAIDQFEETFTACADEDERAAFIAELVRLAQEPGGRVVVVLALRADHYGRCARYPVLPGLLAANNVLVGALRRAELREAVEQPARRAGLRVEPELVDALVDDVEREPGGLPLLSTALLELWQRRDGRRLILATYERIGGVHGAVARLAEDAWSQLDGAQQALARGVLLRLTSPTDDGGVERRRVALAELESGGDEDLARIVALLTDRRLLTVSSGSVELAHEALLREWPRLAAWIDEDRDGLRVQRALTAAATEWQRLGRDDGAVYRGTRLGEAVARRGEAGSTLTALEHDFLAASEAVRRREQVTRRRRVRLTGAAAAALAAALAAIAVALAFTDRERDIAASRDLAAKSATLRPTDPGIALTLARMAHDRHSTGEAQVALRQSTLAQRATRVVQAHDGIAAAIAVSADGRRVATGGADRRVRVWSLPELTPLRTISVHRGEVAAVSLSADGSVVASSGRDGIVAVSDVGSGRHTTIARLRAQDLPPGAEPFARALALSPRGDRLVFGDGAGRVRIADGLGARPTLRGLLPDHEATVYATRFSGDGARVVSAAGDGSVLVRSASGAGRPVRLDHPRRLAFDASFSRDGSRVATIAVSPATLATSVRVWDVAGGRSTGIAEVDQPLNSVCFSGDGRQLVAAGADGVLRVLDAAGGPLVSELRGHEGEARAELVPGGRDVVSTGDDGTLRRWLPPRTLVVRDGGDLPMYGGGGRYVVSGDSNGDVHLVDPASGRHARMRVHDDDSIPQLASDGRTIVSASHDGTVRVIDVAAFERALRDAAPRVALPVGRPPWIDLRTLPGSKFAVAIDRRRTLVASGGESPLAVQRIDGGAPPRRLVGHGDASVNALAFNPDRDALLTGADDGTVREWDVRVGRARIMRGHDGRVFSVAYSADGRRAVSGGSDGTVRVWSGDGDQVILVGHEGAVRSAEFNRRGDRIVSTGDDGTVRIWDPAGGDALLVLHRYGRAALGAGFSPDGRRVVSATYGGDELRISDCEVCGSIAGVIDVARSRAEHELTAAERQRLLPGGG